MSKLEEYKRAEQPIAKTMLRWHLYGAGLENLGKAGKPEAVDVPTCGPEELLVRQDACGLCFSDTKVINLGPNHPRLTGRDMVANPVTLGHEVSVTVVGVGEKVKDRFKVGDRFVVQADVFYKGKSMAYGYVFSGGLAEYSIIPKEVIFGDEGCYLLPIREDTGYAESALTEPWACVVSAYAQSHRDGVKDGGSLVVIAGPDAAANEHDWAGLLTAGHKPARVIVDADSVQGKAREGLVARAKALGIALEQGHVDWAGLKAKLDAGELIIPELEKFDDILILGNVAPEIVEGAATSLADHGILNIVSDRPISRKLSLDIGRIHYNWHHYLGTNTADPAASYKEVRTSDLLHKGLSWFIGAGGPMGQMHVQRAVQHKLPPKLIVATDVDAVRLQSVADRFGGIAKERGIELITLNPKELGNDTFNAELKRLSEGRGFDDVVSMVPVAALIEHASDYLAKDGWFNVFAGVARGTMATIDVNPVIGKGVRYIGSSGSSLSDMRETLARVESDELSTNASLAAIGGMSAALEGMRAVKEGWFPGKTMIFPLIHDLPLTPLAELKEKLPTVYAKLQDGKFWTQEAEEELLRLTIAKE